ncbi:DUF2793 domain-containing protein [Jannaschia pohangensis]|uniref:C1q domain-containing protein n=1 Tax=Jannaschia pohangensis TaxID=390807 RepID=A0A1I3TNR0_9RHOB|nr:DUF2793 domain-containing protein [Jannaschia pohangensis]SFJ71187.1 C1q domain-containing protein [Jannaschia pohangensis]
MSENTPRLGMPMIQLGQAQKHVTHNEAIAVLDALVQPVAQDADRTDPPATPGEGDVHVVANGATGAWAGQDHALAVYFNSGWTFHTPSAGWTIHVLASDQTLSFDGSSWATRSVEATAMLGVNAQADETNRLTVSAAATLLTHDGDDHRLIVNKASPSDTASLLFQSGWSGRAEMGTMGNDDFAVKVSADGAVWRNAVTFDSASGVPSFPALPAFVAASVGTWAEITTPNTDLPFETITTDPGGYFDTATGAFTAPVSGIYAFVLNGSLAQTTNGRVSLAVNGVTQIAQMQALVGAMPLSFTVLQPLEAGDNVTFRTGNVNAMLRYYKGHMVFSGWKVA